ncbi:MAG: glycosyltransferase family 39 protein [Bacteroidales bacterium]
MKFRNAYILPLILLFFGAVLLQNLNKLPLLEDEALNGLIALEMSYSGDLIKATTAGEHYFNHPPLYHWILLFFFNLFGSVNTIILRLPVVLSLLGFILALFFYLKRHFGGQTALLTALF